MTKNQPLKTQNEKSVAKKHHKKSAARSTLIERPKDRPSGEEENLASPLQYAKAMDQRDP